MYVRTYLPARLPARLHARLPARLPARLSARLPARPPACLPALNPQVCNKDNRMWNKSHIHKNTEFAPSEILQTFFKTVFSIILTE
jgi:hypothetical protein